ncbi:PAS domain S-box protein [Algoriphagus sp. PAP.12]|uniref:PAS domain S-box protein n=1 Tax=Algoriphagus sp. PAP.12 TaxID=2996678 RepID=UPI00227C13B8|nr:PAS domain S-box protein [Algoriphagus sp. PAP.12]
MANLLRKIFFGFPILSGLTAFFLAVIFGLFLSYKEYQLRLIDDKKAIIDLGEIIEERIQSVLFTANSSAKILSYLAQNNGLDEDFDKIGSSIIENIDILNQIQLLDSGTIVASYPIEGREKILGYNILQDTSRSSEAKEAIFRRDIYFAGPFELKQGGTAIIGRLPFFENDRFEGFASVIIDWEDFKNETIAPFIQNDRITFDLLKTDPKNLQTSSLLQKSFENLSGPLVEIPIPEGNWTIKIQLNENYAFKEILFPEFIRFLTAVLLGVFVFNFTKQPSILQKKIAETTRELQESNQRFEYASLASSEMIWDWDIKSDQVYRSPNFEKHLGYTTEELNSNSDFWFSLFHPDDREENLNRFYAFLKSSQIFWEAESRIRTKSGDYIYVLEKAFVVRNKYGKPLRIIGSTQNITGRKIREKELQETNQKLKIAIEELELSKQKYSMLFDLTPSPIIVHDSKSLQILDVNKAAVKKYGYSKEEFLALNIMDIRPEKEVPDLLEYLEEFRKSEEEGYTRLAKHLKKNGEIMDVEISPAIIKTKEMEAALALVNDLTDKMAYIRKIEEQNKTFKEIAWIQSHVVRAPLARIMGLVTLLENSNERLSKENQELVNFISISSTELDSIIRGIGKKLDNIAQNENNDSGFYFGENS